MTDETLSPEESDFLKEIGNGDICSIDLLPVASSLRRKGILTISDFEFESVYGSDTKKYTAFRVSILKNKEEQS